LIQGGYDICHMLEAGITANNVAGMLVANSDRGGPNGISLQEARAAVGAAAKDLC
jgi:hypothetical protein